MRFAHFLNKIIQLQVCKRKFPFVIAIFFATLLIRVGPQALAAGNECNSEAHYKNYEVQKGDTLSSILYREPVTPLWGKSGFVVKIFEQNKDILQAPDKIFPGDVLRLPALCPTPALLAERTSQSVTQAAAESIEAVDAPKSWQSHLELSLGSGWSRLDSSISSSGATANLLSKQMWDLDLRWEPHWSAAFHSFVELREAAEPFVSADVGTVAGGSQNLSAVLLGSNYEFQNGARVELAAGANQYVFAPSYFQGTVNLESKSLPVIKGQVSWPVFKGNYLTERLALGACAQGGASGSSYTVNPGSSYFLNLRAERSLTSGLFFLELKAEQLSQSTSQAVQSYRDIWTRLGIQWAL